MKIQCSCGELVIAKMDSSKYCWMTGPNWRQLLDTIDREVESIKDPSMSEQAIMRIRYAATSSPMWECTHCQRLMTLQNGEAVFYASKRHHKQPASVYGIILIIQAEVSNRPVAT